MSVFSVADMRAGMPKGHQATHMLHPTTLDSIIQAAFTVMPDGGTRLQSAFVPRRIRTLRVRPTIPISADHEFDTYAVRDRLDLHALEVSVTVVDSSSPASSPGAAAPAPPMVELEGLLIQSVAGGSAADRPREPYKDDVCSRWEWAPDISLLDPEQLRGRLRFPVEPAEVDMVMDLRRATVHHIRDTLDSLTPAEIDALQDHHRKLHRWMVRQLDLARQNALGGDSAGWLDMGPDKKRALFERVAAASVNGEMLCRLGGLAASILRQEVAPLKVMLEGRLLFRYYKDALKWDRSTRQVGELIKLCTHKNPWARILEIGAGTGGGTQIILDALERGRDTSGVIETRLERYDFTDISSGFFEAAKERFAGCSQVMSFQKLDIEEDPTGQGFEAGAYDVVIACQVLHATKRMVDTLRNVRKLLKPGGKLILVETTRDELDVFFSFGLLPGWWLST
jgi:phospholipid N-methyltransferase